MMVIMVVFSPGLTGRVYRLDETRMEHWLPVSSHCESTLRGKDGMTCCSVLLINNPLSS